VLLVEMLDPAVRSIKEFTRITGAEPLAIIPLMLTAEDYRKKDKARKRLMILAALLILVVLVIVHHFVMSLDILWFKVMTKINML
jgi:cell division protein ZapA (FtsZ GTPase activity inhibitor)